MSLLSLLVFWGVWLLIPLAIDGGKALVGLVSALVARRVAPRARPLMGEDPPLVTITVPIYNSEATLEACLRSIAAQSYPLNAIEVLLIDNGSRDRSFELFLRVRQELPLAVDWLAVPMNGKAWAVNAGIHLARGDYLINVDSDAALDGEAVERIVAAFRADPQLAAATGAIAVLPAPPDATPAQRLLAACEWFEYLQAFQVGRVAQSALDNVYTLSGAFSAFRRDALLQTSLYTQRTVVEDCDLTFEFHARGLGRVGAVPEAVAFVHPIEGLRQLYAQRVRWQRGQVEVSAEHPELLARPIWRLRGFSPARTLLIDHALAFPRVAWTVLLPLLPLFGYAPALIVQASLVLYGLYLLIDALWVAAALVAAPHALRGRSADLAWAIPLMPLYRMLVFWFRLAGFLYAVAEPGAWRVQDPLTQIREAAIDSARRVREGLGRAKR